MPLAEVTSLEAVTSLSEQASTDVSTTYTAASASSAVATAKDSK